MWLHRSSYGGANVGTNLPEDRSCTGSIMLCECMNCESVRRNRCWYSECVTIMENEGEKAFTAEQITSRHNNSAVIHKKPVMFSCGGGRWHLTDAYLNSNILFSGIENKWRYVWRAGKWDRLCNQVTRDKIKDKPLTENAAWEITDSFFSISLLDHIEKSPLTKIGTASD